MSFYMNPECSLSSVVAPVLLMSPVSFLILGGITCMATMGLLLLQSNPLYAEWDKRLNLKENNHVCAG